MAAALSPAVGGHSSHLEDEQEKDQYIEVDALEWKRFDNDQCRAKHCFEMELFDSVI